MIDTITRTARDCAEFSYMAATLGGDDLPTSPTLTDWTALDVALGRLPSDEEARRFARSYELAMDYQTRSHPPRPLRGCRRVLN